VGLQGHSMPRRRIHYVTYRQLVDDTLSLIGRIPSHVTAIAGVPRSGMCPAGIIATTLHLPLFAATRDGLVKLGHGRRLTNKGTPPGTCLVVDDSALRGESMARAVQALGLPSERILTAVVYAHPWTLRHARVRIDFSQHVLGSPRFFEWNLLNHRLAGEIMCDIDGVICRDPAEPDDDSDNYAAALEAAAPFHLPRRRTLNTLITHRLERWRGITCNWLARYNVRYDNLVMAPQLTAAQRRVEMRPYGRWKGCYFRQSSCRLFIESSAQQAIEIYQTSCKPVVCIETGSVYS
jgi:orotate phosphoribosyltransferase